MIGGFYYFEMKAKPFFNKKLNRISYSATLVLLVSIFLKLFSFSIMNNNWNIFSDLFIIILNICLVIDIVLRIMLDKKQDIRTYFSSNHGLCIIQISKYN